MAAKGRGGGTTPERIIELVNDEVAKFGQNAVARAVGLPLYSVQKYMKGIAEPSTATIIKLANYFGVEGAWLRGDISNTYPRVKDLLAKIITEKGKEAVSKETSIPLSEIISICSGEYQTTEHRSLEILANYLGIPVELFSGHGLGSFNEKLTGLLNKAILKKGIIVVESETSIPSSHIARYYKGATEPSIAIINKLSECYNVSVEWLRGEQLLEDESKRALEEMFTSIEWIKSYSVNLPEIVKYTEVIEKNAGIIMQALANANHKMQTMSDRTRELINSIPSEQLPEFIKRLQERLQQDNKQ